MTSERLPAERGAQIRFAFDGMPIVAYEGETVATALLAAGVNGFHATREGDVRQPLCNMGTCFDCAVTIDGAGLVRSCLTPVRDGMQVSPTEGF